MRCANQSGCSDDLRPRSGRVIDVALGGERESLSSQQVSLSPMLQTAEFRCPAALITTRLVSCVAILIWREHDRLQYILLRALLLVMGAVCTVDFQIMCASNGSWLCGFKVTHVICTYHCGRTRATTVRCPLTRDDPDPPTTLRGTSPLPLTYYTCHVLALARKI